MNNPFAYSPDEMCEAAFHELVARLDVLKLSGRKEDVDFCRELDEGKMLGVLIAEDAYGARQTLYAFSGQLGSGGFYHSGFVGPVFDYLRPDGYFKTKEREISLQNAEIAAFEQEVCSPVKCDYERMKSRHDAEIAEVRESYRISKSKRDARRKSASPDENELAEMIRRSQFEKAELRRLKIRLAKELEPFAIKLQETGLHLETMKEHRRTESELLQQWLFSNFKLLNARGESKTLSEIFADTPMRIPPSGAGECCAPKLLQEAYLRGLKPIVMAEYWYGKPKGGEVRIHGQHYPACRGKCLPILNWMLQGLDIEPPLVSESLSIKSYAPEIIYENQWFCIVDKPSGMLSVQGKGAAVSVQQWLSEKYGAAADVRMAHRLDQDTSGLLIATFGPLAYKTMQSLFATRRVHKTYIADLEGSYEMPGVPKCGRIELPLASDILDRPRQKVNFENGKEAVTDYEFIGSVNGRSRVTFRPLTGRTHQLRVHAASSQGLGMPIAGDRLYGIQTNANGERLHLHAQKIEFTFPIDGGHYSFESPVPF